ncbi:SprT family zinc-dependent metalloprotease [Bowmanella dokdonensis]|uniref:SprT family zinc-dependent metalloprotease n=1 Tax=Bowmanella dokdonensis TaxID=751969 RepID=A0A939DRR3_9ALTE|nr:SprT family zinc-dependent metalloprotease [Bowmanella dokdonensis]MBN7827585.1 SprT family zinc-dependent metalloprotease [Bowmanella dokdonensis]
MRLPSPIQLEQVQQRLDDCLALVQEQLKFTPPRPLLTFTQRGRIAGTARLQANEIRLNPVLLRDNLHEFLEEVIPHELCHLLVWQLHGRGTKARPVRPHGAQWKQLMWEVFGLKGSACHRMDVSKVQGRQFNYQCRCGPVKLSVRRHNRVQQGVTYICRHCRQSLQAA